LKNNYLNYFKFFLEECDILLYRWFSRIGVRPIIHQDLQLRATAPLPFSAFAVKSFGARFPPLIPKRYTYRINVMQNQKSTENQKNQLKTFFQLI